MIGQDDLDHPGRGELLAACALLLFENDEFRKELNHPHVSRKRLFTRHDLERGRNMGPMAFMTEDEGLLVKLES